jgi:hypothetical protein
LNWQTLIDVWKPVGRSARRSAGGFKKEHCAV